MCDTVSPKVKYVFEMHYAFESFAAKGTEKNWLDGKEGPVEEFWECSSGQRLVQNSAKFGLERLYSATLTRDWIPFALSTDKEACLYVVTRWVISA